MGGRRRFGIIDRLGSGNYRARYTGPDGKRYAAPSTSRTKGPLEAWLAEQQYLISSGQWSPPEEALARDAVEAEKAAKEAAAYAARQITLADYAEKWIDERTTRHGEALSPRTSYDYRRLMRTTLSDLAPMVLGDITFAQVRAWRAKQNSRGTLTQTSRSYGLLKSIMKTAVEDKLVDENPCRIPGGGSTTTGMEVIPPSDEEYEAVMAALAPAHRALVVLAAASGLRWGEITELRQKDFTIERDNTGELGAVRIKVTRGVIHVPGKGKIIRPPKSRAGMRDLAFFGLEAAIVAAHVEALDSPDTLLFSAAGDPTKHLSQSTFWRHWDKARQAAGRDDLKVHSMRHYHGTRYAQTGATLREIMARLGHSSTVAAMRYQHAGSRDDELAARMARRREDA